MTIYPQFRFNQVYRFWEK